MKTRTTEETKATAREAALEILISLEQRPEFAEEALEKYLSDQTVSPLDRKLARRLVLGVTKMKLRLDYLIRLHLDLELENLTIPIRSVLRMGIYQLDFTQKIPDYAAVDESVNLARKYGHPGVAKLVNAVLRNYLRNKSNLKFPSGEVKYISTYYSFQEWMVGRWLELFGRKNVEELCEYFNSKPRLGFRVNTLNSSPWEAEHYLAKKDLKYIKGKHAHNFFYLDSPIELAQFDLLKEGKIYLQDESSMLAVDLLDPQPGERILDLCAAPGGKTTYIAQKMQNRGKVIAVDKAEPKLNLIRKNSERLKAEIVETVVEDGTKWSSEVVDRILIDAPCSGTGVLGRNADSRWSKRPSDLKRLSDLQLDLLTNAIYSLKPQGILVYSTCSIMPEENQQVIAKFLELYPEMKIEPAGEFVPKELQLPEGYMQSLPHLHGIDGAFAVRMKKK
jgi:16S rRNA (cytosine967-C5)-methyltransferase